MIPDEKHRLSMAMAFIRRKYHDSDVFAVCKALEAYMAADTHQTTHHSTRPSAAPSAAHTVIHSKPYRADPGGCPVCQARRATKARAQARLRARRAQSQPEAQSQPRAQGSL